MELLVFLKFAHSILLSLDSYTIYDDALKSAKATVDILEQKEIERMDLIAKIRTK